MIDPKRIEAFDALVGQPFPRTAEEVAIVELLAEREEMLTRQEVEDRARERRRDDLKSDLRENEEMGRAIKTLGAAVKDALAVLREVECVGGKCPVCAVVWLRRRDQNNPQPHAPDCRLAALLRQA